MASDSLQKMRSLAIEAWVKAVGKHATKKDMIEGGECHLELGKMESGPAKQADAFHRAAILFQAATGKKK